MKKQNRLIGLFLLATGLIIGCTSTPEMVNSEISIPELNERERHVYEIVSEANANVITWEGFSRRADGHAMLHLAFDPEKMGTRTPTPNGFVFNTISGATIDLTRFTESQNEGATDKQVQDLFRFEKSVN